MLRILPYLFIGLLSSQSFAEDSKMAISVQRLTTETALKIAQAAMQHCRQEGIQIGVTVVDRGGHPQVVLRDVLAPDLTLRISQQKAYTAVSFSVATSAMTDRANTAIGRVEGLVMSGGGLPISFGGYLFGGVGVSGAPSGEQDEACAQAGLDAIAMDMEMQSF